MIRLLLSIAATLAASYFGFSYLEDQFTTAGGSTPRPDVATLVKTTDGDTVSVRIGGKEESVRLIGIDTPEVYSAVECGGPEASASIAELVTPGQRVRLFRDPSQDSRDRYGRLLRYVEVDGVDLASEQLRRGWAAVYVFDDDFSRLDRYERASAAAERSGRGAWGICGGDFHSGS